MTKTEMVRRSLMAAGANGKIFTVKFVKRTDGSERTMTCRLGVTKHLRGGTLGYDPREHDLLGVFDMTAGGYRSIDLRTVFEIHSAVLDRLFDLEEARTAAEAAV